MTISNMREQALKLARYHKKCEPKIKAVYWFPSQKEIRLLEVESNLPKTSDGHALVFYFREAVSEGIEVPYGVGLIRPDEVGKLKLPKGWVSWEKAEKLNFSR